MAILETCNLTKKFGTVTALDGVNLKVEKGEVFGFIGPNGSGKTTTIRILLGILQATTGEAKILGLDAWKDAVAIHKKIAYVPGNVNLWPNLTGGEVIDLFASLSGKIDYDKKEELIKNFNLDASKKCRTYSKGNLQKVALIAAFVSDAELYIFDEPTSGLDPLMEQVFQSYVYKLKENGKSVLLSSHILSEVERLCDRVGIIRAGKIVETGTLNELRHLTRANFNIITKQKITGLEKVKGVYDIKFNDENSVSFYVDNSELDAVVKFISKFDLLKLESTPPTLEELFMRHYNNGV